MEVRPSTLDDAEAIRSIYNHEVLTGTATFDTVARTLEEQRRWQQDRSGAHVVLVAVEGTDVLGYGALSEFRDRPAYRTTVEDSVYVSPVYQGRGVGRAVLDQLVATAIQHGFHTVIARIAEHNEASVALHAGCGFALAGVEREVGRKFGRWLDVVVMQRILS